MRIKELDYYDFSIGEWVIEYHLGIVARIKAHFLEKRSKVACIAIGEIGHTPIAE